MKHLNHEPGARQTKKLKREGTVQDIADQVLGSVESEPSEDDFLVHRRFPRVLSVASSVNGLSYRNSYRKETRLVVHASRRLHNNHNQ